MIKAYHVYLFNGPYPSKAEVEPRPFELITHIYSCLNHGTVNPDIPLCLITDERTKKYYDDLNITALYDEVITDLFDDYPRDRISPAFWASPKIWAMSKLQAPFVIFDTDLVLHKPLAHFANCDLLYLHRETSAIYPSIYDLVGRPGFVWDEKLAWSFRNTQPMNCAVVGMFNDAFRADYVKRYFDFVLDAPGEVLHATEGSRTWHPCSAAQIVAEQWLLAAVADFWKYAKGTPIRTQAMCKVIWTSERFFPLDMDLPFEDSDSETASSFYHLWGAKLDQDEKGSLKYLAVRDALNRGRHIVERNDRFNAVRGLFDKLMDLMDA